MDDSTERETQKGQRGRFASRYKYRAVGLDPEEKERRVRLYISQRKYKHRINFLPRSR